MLKLAEITWGDDSAELDPNLLEYFLGSPALLRLESKQKPFAIGRKGSGKSALRKKLQDHFSNQPRTTVLNIAPTYNSIRSILNEKALSEGFGEEVFFQYVWLKQMLLECLNCVGQTAGGGLVSGSMAFAREIAKQRSATPPDLIESLTAALQRLKIKAGKLGDLGVAVEAEVRAAAEIEALEANFRDLVSEGHSFVVLIDDLDLGWDNSETSNRLLLGLLSARTYLASISHRVYPCVFLREDVYSIIISLTGHADKYRNVERLRWDKQQLIELLNKRINFARKNHSLAEVENPFGTVFPETIGTSYTDNWLIERTLSRPRELIQFARFYTERVTGTEPDADVLRNTETEYSNWKLEDLCSEYSNQFPQLNAVFAFWRTKFFRQKYHLSRSELDEMLLRILSEVPVNVPWFNDLVTSADSDGLLNILYEVGFIGDFVRGGAGGSKIFYAFADPHEPVFDEVQIHPCFRRAVGTVERIRTKSSAAGDDSLQREAVHRAGGDPEFAG